jgi:hypothetical protein
VSRLTTRIATAARPWTTTTTFGWSGTAAVDDVYPDGRVQSPQPVFLRLLNDVTVTADVTESGAAPAGSSPITLRATLGDASGWSRTWALDRAVISAGSPVHLSAPLNLNNLYYEMAWNQVATGAVNPITLTLTVDSGQAAIPPAHLAFSLDRLLFKPLGALTTTTRGSVASSTRTVATVRLAGKSISVDNLRKAGAILVGAGLILGAAATLTSRGRRSRRGAQPVAPPRLDIPSQRQEVEQTAPEWLSL